MPNVKVLRESFAQNFLRFFEKNSCKKFCVAYKCDVPNETVSFGR